MTPLAKKFIPFIVSLALFMEALDTTIINTAIPAMAKSLQVNPVNLKIALISYLLSLAVFIPISGWVADKYGIKRVFCTALGIFTLSSIWCGFAHNIAELILARTLQGIGGSLTLPIGRLILVRSFARHELVVTMSRVVMVAALGAMLGPVLGGVITHYLSWHWIFWVNIPVGLVTILLAQIWFEHNKPVPIYPLDKLGFIYFGGGLACLTFGMSALSELTLSIHIPIFVLCLAFILLTLYVWHSRSKKHPIVKTSLFKFRTFQISILGNLFSRLGFGGVPFLLPLLFQIGLGYNPQTSGLLLAPTAIGILLIKFFTLRLLHFFGYKRLLVFNTIMVGLSMWSFMLVNSATPIYVIVLLTFVFGFLISLQYSAMNSLAYADIPADNLSSATSIMSTMQQLAQSFGVAVAAFLIHLFTPQLALTTDIFHKTFFSIGLFTFFSMVIFLRLKMSDGEQMLSKGTVEKVIPG